MLRTRQLGEYRISSLVEFYGPTHAPTVYPDYKPELVEAQRDWLVPNHWNPVMNKFVITIQMWIVQFGSQVILIDPGIGNVKKRSTPRQNMLNNIILVWLEAAGASPEKVTQVVMTHLHSDHVGWNTVLDEDGKWVPTFPNARYLLPKENYDFWKDSYARGIPVPDGGAFFDSVEPVVEAGLVDFITTQKEIAGCLEVEPLTGHTPGHMAFHLHSQGEEGVFGGDVMHHPIQIAYPSWNIAFDMLPDVARKNRATFLANTARSGALFMPCHFAPPFCGYIREQAGGYKFEPAEW